MADPMVSGAHSITSASAHDGQSVRPSAKIARKGIYTAKSDPGLREALIDALASADPFALSPADILERVLTLGHGPDVTKHSTEIWLTIGRVFEVRREGQDFIVAISRDAEEISVQEIRADAYMPIE